MEQLILFLASLRPDLAGAGGAPAAGGRSARRGLADACGARRAERHEAPPQGRDANACGRRRAGEEEECRRGAREGRQDRARVLRQERSGERRAAAPEADPGGLHGPRRGRHLLPDPLRLLLCRRGRRIPGQQLDGERGGHHLQPLVLRHHGRRGRLFPAGPRARSADLDQDARIPQRLSRFHGPDDRLLRRRHGDGGGHRARVEGIGDDLSRAQPEFDSSCRWSCAPGAASTTR